MRKKVFHGWNAFELCLLAFSLLVITTVFCLGEDKNPLSLLQALFGVTAVLFVAKGLIAGQYLSVIFLSLYAALSYFSEYYGECILVVFVSLPCSLAAIISWHRHPAARGVVRVNKISKREWIVLAFAVAGITAGMYFLLNALHTAQVIVSTVSFITSLSAAYLLIRRSEYYAVFYVLNDIILIVLWSFALAAGDNVLPSIISYCVFLLNDTYGFIDWRRRARLQTAERKE